MATEKKLSNTSCVILALVAKRPMSGYDIGALATRSIAHFWPISRSQVYGELARLEEAGYVVGTHVEQDNRPDKRPYELTSAGETALAAWLASDDYPPDRTRSGLLSKFFFADQMTPDQRLALLSRYRAEIGEYRVELQTIVDKLEGRPGSAFGHATALYGLLTTEAKLHWVDHMIESIGAPAVAESPSRS